MNDQIGTHIIKCTMEWKFIMTFWTQEDLGWWSALSEKIKWIKAALFFFGFSNYVLLFWYNGYFLCQKIKNNTFHDWWMTDLIPSL